MSLEGRYDSYKRKGSQSPDSKKPRESFAQNKEYDSLFGINPSKQAEQSRAKPDWNEQLNMTFVTKVFKPESSFFVNLGKIWELQAQLEELTSLIIPEATRTKNILIVDFSEKILQCSQ